MYTEEEIVCENFGDVLYKLRKERGLSQKAVAEKIGCCENSVTTWEKGRREPRSSFMVSYAKLFHIKTKFLYMLKDKYKKTE